MTATVADVVEMWLHAVAGDVCGPAWSTVVYVARDVIGPELGAFDCWTLSTADIEATWLRLVDDGEHPLDVRIAQHVLDEAYKLAELLGVAPMNPAAAVLVT